MKPQSQGVTGRHGELIAEERLRDKVGDGLRTGFRWIVRVGVSRPKPSIRSTEKVNEEGSLGIWGWQDRPRRPSRLVFLNTRLCASFVIAKAIWMKCLPK